MIQDLRYAWRALLRRPVFFAVAVAVLALGIGANTAIFSVVYSVLLRPLPFKDPDRLLMVFSHNTKQHVSYSGISADDFSDFQKQNTVFDGLASVTPKWGFNLSSHGEAEQIFGKWVSANFFEVVGVQPALGRAFTSDEDRPQGDPVVILSHEAWQGRFGGDSAVLGRTLMLDGSAARIVGVMPRDFRFIDDGEIWVPAGRNPISARGRNVRYLTAVARLKPGIAIERAASEMRGVASRLEIQYPATNAGFTTDLRGLHEHVTGDTRRSLLLLAGAVGLVLLMACANVANLLLVYAADRQREVALRTALGADRRRLVRQFLTESVLLAVIGGGFGLVLADWGIRLLVSLRPNLPRLDEIHMDTSVLAFSVLLSIATGVLFGVLPAMLATRSNLNDILKDGGRAGGSAAARSRMRSLLVCEVAVATVLLIGSGLLVRSFQTLLEIDPGFRTGRIIVVNTLIPSVKYPQAAQREALYYRIEDRLKDVPGVLSVAAASRIPLSAVLGSNNVTAIFAIEGKPVEAGERAEADYRIASSDYFETMGIPLIRGRKFTREDSTEVALINLAAAGKFWGDENPVGKRLDFANAGQSAWVTVIGVVGNVRHLGLEAAPRAEVYRPYGNNPLTGPMVVIHTAGDPHAMLALIKSELRAIESEMPLTLATIDDLIDLSVGPRRFSMLVLALFAGAALALAIVGIYGVMACSVSQRRHEIGLRMALGAEAGQVQRMVVREGLILTGIGVAIGIGGALALTRLMKDLLFGITPGDPATYAAASLGLVAVAAFACYLPARRASRVDPLRALRRG